MELYTGLEAVTDDTMPCDTYPLNLAGTQLQRVADAVFEFGLTPGLAKPYQMAGMTGS